jgi:hypothetical protein
MISTVTFLVRRNSKETHANVFKHIVHITITENKPLFMPNRSFYRYNFKFKRAHLDTQPVFL